jgi:hypothetical protein
MLLEGLAVLTSPAVILTVPESPFLPLDPALILRVSTFPVSLVTVMLPPFVVLELELRAPVVMSPFPLTLVTVMLPPFVVLELELRSRVLMSPLASRAIAPPFVVRFVLSAMLLAA